jgi:uncharacterized membrane protein
VFAFATALLFALAGDAAVLAYGRRRKPGQPLTWGEAMAASVFAFILMMLWYGIVPHQWITLADTEWKWRSDRILFGPGNILEPQHWFGKVPPFTITYQALRDLVVLAIYGAGLTLHVFHWVHWQNRSKPKAEVVPTTAYGRPLVKKA